jgi:ribosomal protein S18 acetylase RimI-like enzyme
MLSSVLRVDMATGKRAAIDHDDRRRIHEYLERYGTVPEEELRDSLRVDPRGFRHHVAILRRDGHVERVDGGLRVAVDRGERERFGADGVEFAVRPARESDLSGLVGVIRQVAGAGYIEGESVADVLAHEGTLLVRDELESRTFFVACVDDEVVGWVGVDAPEQEKLAHTAELTLGVLEGYRGRGVGSQLLERGVTWAGANGTEKLYNSVPATNEAAIDFLEDRNWAVEAVREDHYRIDGDYVDEVMMARYPGSQQDRQDERDQDGQAE